MQTPSTYTQTLLKYVRDGRRGGLGVEELARIYGINKAEVLKILQSSSNSSKGEAHGR